ncbi:hypothetical protein K439DRAFT_511386 [Ramaria rubella]|nr:hypothetical protein K439DRAFT_511386 [Ramaria rubella]
MFSLCTQSDHVLRCPLMSCLNYLRQTRIRSFNTSLSHRKTILHKRKFQNTTQRWAVGGSQTAHEDILTALDRTTVILPNILDSQRATAWQNVLYTSGRSLSGVEVRRPRIAVLGLDELSQPHELVSALLDDPLSSDQSHVHVLKSRHRQPSHHPLIISPGELQRSSSILSLNLPWLQKMDVDILEIPPQHPDTITLLYGADIQILITGPLASPLSLDYLNLLSSPSSFLLLQYPTHDERIVEYAVSQITRLLPSIHDTLKSRVLHVYPSKALSALDLFRQESSSVDAVQIFQQEFLASGVTALSQSLLTAISSKREIRIAHQAHLVLLGALAVCRSAAHLTSRETATVQKRVDDLRVQISEVQKASVRDILGGSEVEHSIQMSTRELRTVMDAIPWWKLPFKIDDLNEVLFHSIERVWCRDLQAKLEFQTGRLAFLRSTLTSETLKTIHLLPTSFQSAVLANQIHQISTRPPEMGPNTMTYPILYRLQQLQQAILILHRRAQRNILALSVTTLGSVSSTYVVWLMDWVAPSTAMGFGALGTMVGLRWFVGRWEKGKKRWWEDWRRVGSGLERDIKEMLDLVVNETVTSVPSKAAEELEGMVALRTKKMAELKKELESIEGNLQRTYSGHTAHSELHK